MSCITRSTSVRPFNIRRIAIIGAGPTGLAAAKYLLAEKAFETVDIFEQQSEIGGIWNYIPNIVDSVPVPQTTSHGPPEKPIWPEGASAPLFLNPMYDHLNTNIPKDLMSFSDQEFPAESLLFPTRQDVQAYLVKYSQDVRHRILFSTQVQGIQLCIEDNQERWDLTSVSTITNEASLRTYDSVVIANGHYSVPFIPLVPGIEAFHSEYPSIITHSKFFRSPTPFTDKKVIVVGSSASGLDIGTQISLVCKKPLVNSMRTSPPFKLGQENKEEVPPIAEFLIDDRAVRFGDGRIEKDIDAIVYCTGYLYSYPFLKSLDPPVVTNGRRVRGCYQQLFNTLHPTLAFIALSQKIIPFPISEVQGAAIAKVWANKLELPPKDEMELWEKKRIEEAGDGTSFHVLGYPKDAEYINGLHHWVKSSTVGSGKEPAFWGEKKLWMRERYAEIRKKFVETGGHATSMEELGFHFGSSS